MFKAFGLYSHIRANRIRSGFLIAGLFVLVYVLAFAGTLFATAITDGDLPPEALLRLAGRRFLPTLPFVTLGTFAWVLIATRYHQALIDAVTGSHAVTRQEQPRLYNVLEALCISRGLAMPRLEIIDSEVLNAYATGLTPRQHTITVTTGLLSALTDAEVEAVLAHELTHIRNEDVALMVRAAVVAGVISFLAELFFRVVTRIRWSPGSSSSSSRRKEGGGGAVIAIVVAVVLIALAWLLSLVIRFALSRSREYLADAGAVELTKNPDAMISALMKIAGRSELEGVPSGIMEMCIDNPRTGFADLFATHPPIEERVEALVKFAGGRVPELAPPPTPGARYDEDVPPPSPWQRPDAAPGGSGPWGPHAAG